MDAGTRLFVRHRSQDRCEYCRLRQENSLVPHRIEHIVARGTAEMQITAMAGKRETFDISGIDPLTGRVEILFHPRRVRTCGTQLTQGRSLNVTDSWAGPARNVIPTVPDLRRYR